MLRPAHVLVILPAVCAQRNLPDVGLRSPKADSVADEAGRRGGSTVVACVETVQNAIEQG